MMKKSLWLAVGLIAFGGAGSLRADVVQLRNGSTLEGSVREEGTRVWVDVGSGEIAVDRSEVQSISRPDPATQEFDRRLGALRPDDVEGRYQLGLWARQNGLHSRSERLMRTVLERNPNHEGARSALGFMQYKGAWLTADEYKAALGLARYGGEWMPADAAERLRKDDRQQSLALRRESEEAAARDAKIELERARLGVQERVINDLRSQGRWEELMNAFSGASPSGTMRFWGPAAPVPPLPNAP
jgi:hypothetical protein